jgi:hypothetical protein
MRCPILASTTIETMVVTEEAVVLRCGLLSFVHTAR